MTWGQKIDWIIDQNDDIRPLIQGTPLSSPSFSAGNVLGGDTAFGNQTVLAALAGKGVRQGAINAQIIRALGQDFVWDGNPDCGVKVIARNYAANAANQGAERGIDIQARNSGANASWCNAGNFNARNDSGKTAYQLQGITIRLENYGTLETEAVGLDVNMSIENDTGAPVKDAIRVRNTDASGMTACNSVLSVSNTSTNGFTNLFDLTGLTAANGTLISSSGTDATGFAGRLRILDASGTAAYINLYNTSHEA